jgi:two-component system, cell cycle response regulator
MSRRPVKVLLIEDDAGHVGLVCAKLRRNGAPLQVAYTSASGEILSDLREGDFDCILLDLSLPAGRGMEAFVRTHREAPDVPIVVFSSPSDASVAARAVREGAQDHLLTSHITGDVLVRAIRYAIERQRLVTDLREASLRDELTGLYNRRGFRALADHQRRIARRHHEGLGLFLFDLDGLKDINDGWGHPEGDRALQDTALLLRHTFRDSDLLARHGGDEFLALVVESDPGSDEPLARLAQHVGQFNERADRPYRLSISGGGVHTPAGKDVALHELIRRADRRLYAAKRTRTEPAARERRRERVAS